MKARVAVVLGSARSNGNTASLVGALAKNIPLELFDLNHFQIAPFDYQFRNNSDDFHPLMDELLGFDIILMASPIYWYAPSAQLKIFIDRLSDFLKQHKSRGRLLRTKSSGVIATGSDIYPPDCFEQIFDNTLNYLGIKNLGMLYYGCEDEAQFDADDPMILSFASKLAKFNGSEQRHLTSALQA
ncbi:MAG: flavodoxin family protein [Kangiellaceae bacterium]|nr:flavodoxin family protein [Kangiellaceae bacterium]